LTEVLARPGNLGFKFSQRFVGHTGVIRIVRVVRTAHSRVFTDVIVGFVIDDAQGFVQTERFQKLARGVAGGFTFELVAIVAGEFALVLLFHGETVKVDVV